MQHQQQVGGGGYGHLQGGAAAAAEVEVAMSEDDQKLGDLGIAEAASPISSRPPAPTNANFEEMIQATAAAGGGGGASSSSNRWPRQETLALLQIRSEMDTAFRDATLKGPLWDQVSSKLGELGYKRSAKKCKEKFENVHKYYKRTKEGRGGRQDGKSYKFFSQLEALHHSTAAAATAAAAFLPRSTPPSASAAAVSFPPPSVMPQQDALVLPPNHRLHDDPIATAALFGISFSSDSSSDGEGDDDDDDEMEMDMDMDLEMGGDRREQRKRKRSHGGGSDSDEKMMDFFEGLLKQVMQKQEAMQQRFLEAIEKREQDRMIREEAWKRQDMARIAREHDLMAQERAVSASRDAAIIEFLEKITGQNIVLPSNTAVPQNPAVPRSEAQQPSERQNRRRDQPPSDPPPPTPPPPPQTVQVTETATQQPLQDLGGGGMDFGEASSSRWPKAQVLELIKIRSSMEARYQEAGPKGPLWEEISAAMKRIGYSRSAKRCKEKWENINKYFKKVKESNKKRPQDAKTCPYFNELDALYRKKILKYSAAAGSGSTSFSQQDEHVGGVLQVPPQSLAGNIVSSEDHKADDLQTSGSAFGEHSHNTNIGGETQPEDMLNKGHDQESRGETTENNIHCSNSDDLDEDIYDEVDDNQEYDDDDKTEEEMKMVYKIQFQRQNVASSNGAGTSAPAPSSFVAMVQ